MPKPKKGSKKHAVDDSDEEFVDPIKAAAEETTDNDPVASLPAVPSKKKSKAKKKGKKRDDSDDDEDIKRLEQLTLAGSDDEETPRPVQKAKKGKAKPAAAMSAFAMLGADSDDAPSDQERSDNSECEEESAPKPVKKKAKSVNDEDDELAINGVNEGTDDLDSMIAALPADSGDESSKKSSKKDKKKKKSKKQKPQQAEEEDLDAILADLDKPAGDKANASALPPKAPEADDKGDDGTPKIEESVPEGGAVEEGAELSAAAKKRLKKQKQKEKKEQEEAGPNKEAPSAEPMEAEEEGDDSGKKKKKKKDKKAAAVEETADDKKKKPVNKKIAAMREALAKAKEDQERLEREEEEKIRKLEEAKRLRDEERQMKEEQRQKQREKDKERKEKKKQEGKLLTPAQKAERERALQMLAARGIELPKPGDKPKKPYYGRPRKNKAKDDKNTNQSEAKPQTEGSVSAVDKDAKTVVDPPAAVTKEVVVETKDDWEESEEGIKDEWDAESDAEAEPIVAEPVVVKVEPVVKEEEVEEEEQESESEEEDSEEEEEDSEESDEESSSEEEEMTPRERALARIMKRQRVAEANKSTDKLRAPVVCVLGHVDTGKTKILDKLRRTNVQDGEAGGITQQIGATNVPLDAIHKQTSFIKDFKLDELKVPGLLIIDTPGHESFSNLRTRGSSLCDIAILVIDVMHGLEPQTLESIQLLKKGKTPFLVALNKIDRMYGWKSNPYQDVHTVIKKQTANTKSEFDERAAMAITQLAEQGLNAALFYENPNPKEYISLVPTSAHSGDGMGNLIALLCQYSQTYLAKRVAVTDDLQCTVMEVKALPGLGTTVDVILVNGRLRNGDVVVMPGTEGPIVTHIRELLMPEPMKELRVKSQFKHHKEVEAAQGVKIVGKELDKVMAGLPMYVAKYQDEVEVYKGWIAAALKNVLNAIKLSSTGVFVQASTLGSMEALLEYLRSVKVPYAGINIGPVHKKDVMKASVMIEHGESEYATLLAFDVKVERDANELADSLGVKIFTADIIYHLFDAFTKYQEELLLVGQRENNHLKIFPCKLRILPQFIFNSRDPIIMGVIVESGFLANGTPICVPTKEFIQLGVVTSIERENKSVDRAAKGMEVCIKIENLPGQAPRLYGRHFDENDMLVSKISRDSIDAVKKYWKKDMSKEDWKLIIELKKTFEIL